MRSLILLSFMLTMGLLAQEQNVELPPHGMTCTSIEGYVLDIYPDLSSENRLEFNLVSSKGELVDDNFHQYKFLTPKIISGNDGVLMFSIFGLEEDSLKHTHVFYNNDVLDLVLLFNDCDVI